MKGLWACESVNFAGITAAEVERLAEFDIWVAREGTGRFLKTNVKVRLTAACELAGPDHRG